LKWPRYYGNNKPPEPIIMSGQPETRRGSQINFIIFLSGRLCCGLHHPQQTGEKLMGKKYFAEPKATCADILHPILI